MWLSGYTRTLFGEEDKLDLERLLALDPVEVAVRPQVDCVVHNCRGCCHRPRELVFRQLLELPAGADHRCLSVLPKEVHSILGTEWRR